MMKAQSKKSNCDNCENDCYTIALHALLDTTVHLVVPEFLKLPQGRHGGINAEANAGGSVGYQ
jgi:hypothetical protein